MGSIHSRSDINQVGRIYCSKIVECHIDNEGIVDILM